MGEIQDSFADFSQCIRRSQKYHTKAKGTRQFPKSVVDMIEDKRQSNRSDFSNFESEKSMKELFKQNR